MAWETIPSGMDFAPLLKGLPDDMCQCPHWGYLFRGRILVRYKGGEETISGGHAYYMPPGHSPVYLEESEGVEFSPRAELERTKAVVMKNLEAIPPSA